jgi:hypothetical protein
MLADELDYVIGVDTHRDEHALAVVAAPAGAVVAGQKVRADARGDRAVVRFVGLYARGGRAWAIEGSGSTAPGLPAISPIGAKRCSRSAAHREAEAASAARTMPSTRRGQREQRSPAAGSRCRAQASGAKRCDWC